MMYTIVKLGRVYYPGTDKNEVLEHFNTLLDELDQVLVNVHEIEWGKVDTSIWYLYEEKQ